MKKILMMTCLFLFTNLSHANSTCHGNFVNPITDICWSCLFPISIGSAGVIKGSVPDTKNPQSPLCACGSPIPRVGLSVGFWEPVILVDVTRHPFCLVNLGGVSLPMGSSFHTGGVETAEGNDTHSFYYVHWYIYPLLNWLKLVDDLACAQGGDLDIPYLTELDPTWRDDELHFLTDPEALLFANPIAQIACTADSAKATFSTAIDSLFWCAGAQGSMYPLTGWVQEHVSGAQASVLLAERLAFKMHRLGIAWDSVGEDGPALCSTYPSAILPKSRYRYQMVNPLPTTGQTGCHPFGAGTFTWEAFHQYPFKGEDYGYLIWRKRNCCFL
jgi:conjugal transfer pilus assembly protein TraU